MKEVDQLLEDAALVESVYDAQGKRHRKSRTHGCTQTPAEVALRLLILKHVRRMVAADTGFYSLKNEKTIQGMGSDASRGAESEHQKQRTEKTSENALVPGWAALADRMRRPH
jgi:hypothetical protein